MNNLNRNTDKNRDIMENNESSVIEQPDVTLIIRRVANNETVTNGEEPSVNDTDNQYNQESIVDNDAQDLQVSVQKQQKETSSTVNANLQMLFNIGSQTKEKQIIEFASPNELEKKLRDETQSSIGGKKTKYKHKITQNITASTNQLLQPSVAEECDIEKNTNTENIVCYETRFKCKICGKEFKKRTDVTEHRKRHKAPHHKKIFVTLHIPKHLAKSTAENFEQEKNNSVSVSPKNITDMIDTDDEPLSSKLRTDKYLLQSLDYAPEAKQDEVENVDTQNIRDPNIANIIEEQIMKDNAEDKTDYIDEITSNSDNSVAETGGKIDKDLKRKRSQTSDVLCKRKKKQNDSDNEQSSQSDSSDSSEDRTLNKIVAEHYLKKYLKLTKKDKAKRKRKQKIFKCKICLLHFLKQRQLTRHIDGGNHNTNGNYCYLCTLHFDENIFKKHVEKHHLKKGLKLSNFYVSTVSSSSDSSDTDNNDDSTKKIEPKTSTLNKNHIKQADNLKSNDDKNLQTADDPKATCSPLIKLADIPNRNATHFIVYKCEKCDLCFHYIHSLNRHKKNNKHNLASTMKCQLCHLTFTTHALKQHNHWHHNTDMKEPITLDILSSIQTKIKTLTLNKCHPKPGFDFNRNRPKEAQIEKTRSKVFDNINNVMRKQRKCVIQRKEENEKKNVNEDQSETTDDTGDIDDRLYKCSRCKIYFVEEKALLNHMAIGKHKAKEHFRCPLCNYTFNYVTLKVHMNIQHSLLGIDQYKIIVSKQETFKLCNDSINLNNDRVKECFVQLTDIQYTSVSTTTNCQNINLNTTKPGLSQNILNLNSDQDPLTEFQNSNAILYDTDVINGDSIENYNHNESTDLHSQNIQNVNYLSTEETAINENDDLIKTEEMTLGQHDTDPENIKDDALDNTKSHHKENNTVHNKVTILSDILISIEEELPVKEEMQENESRILDTQHSKEVDNISSSTIISNKYDKISINLKDVPPTTDRCEDNKASVLLKDSESDINQKNIRAENIMIKSDESIDYVTLTNTESSSNLSRTRIKSMSKSTENLLRLLSSNENDPKPDTMEPDVKQVLSKIRDSTKTINSSQNVVETQVASSLDAKNKIISTKEDNNNDDIINLLETDDCVIITDDEICDKTEEFTIPENSQINIADNSDKNEADQENDCLFIEEHFENILKNDNNKQKKNVFNHKKFPKRTRTSRKKLKTKMDQSLNDTDKNTANKLINDQGEDKRKTDTFLENSDTSRKNKDITVLDDKICTIDCDNDDEELILTSYVKPEVSVKLSGEVVILSDIDSD